MSPKPSDELKGKIDDLISALISADYWSRFLRLHIMGIHDSSGNNENLNWISPTNSAQYLQQNGSITFIPYVGLKGGGTTSDYIDTNFNASIDGSAYLNDLTLGLWIAENGWENEKDATSVDTTHRLSCYTRTENNQHSWAINTDQYSSSDSNAVYDSKGLNLFTRTASNATASYRNGSKIDSDNTVSTILPNADLYICGSPAGDSTKATSVFFIMDGINDSEAAELYNIFNTYKWWYDYADYDLRGFGTDSKFAYELYDQTSDPGDLPTIIYVDNLGTSTSTTNSLPWALTRNYPRIILFNTSGTIDFRATAINRIDIDYPYCWVVGQSAPDPGIELEPLEVFSQIG